MKFKDLGLEKISKDPWTAIAQVGMNINEGPLDALKNVGRMITDPTDKSGKQEMYKYKKSMQTQFQRWANQTGAGKPDLNNEDLICQWLTDQYGVSQKEIAGMGLKCGPAGGEKPGQEKPAGGATPPAPGAETPKPGAPEAPAGGATPPAPGAETPKPEGGATPPEAEAPKPGAEAPKPGAEAPKPGAETPPAPGAEAPAAEEKPKAGKNPMFKDPTKFKAEWDKYVEGQNAKNKANGMGDFKLISEPKLLAVLKQMWMSSGGTKAESKKNKATPIVENKKKKLAVFK